MHFFVLLDGWKWSLINNLTHLLKATPRRQTQQVFLNCAVNLKADTWTLSLQVFSHSHTKVVVLSLSINIMGLNKYVATAVALLKKKIPIARFFWEKLHELCHWCSACCFFCCRFSDDAVWRLKFIAGFCMRCLPLPSEDCASVLSAGCHF